VTTGSPTTLTIEIKSGITPGDEVISGQLQRDQPQIEGQRQGYDRKAAGEEVR